MVIETDLYKIAAYGSSNVGLVRQNNEDAWSSIADLNLYLLADGMGGHQAGEVASAQAVKAVSQLMAQRLQEGGGPISLHDMRKELYRVIQEANSQLYKLSRSDRDLRGMGTTLCCLLFHGKGLIYGHVGDSRIYRFRRGHLKQLTKDHSLLAEMVDQGHFAGSKGIDLSYKNIITKAMGTEPSVEPSVHLCDIEIGDLFMMCTDGLTDMLGTKEIQSLLLQGMALEESVSELIATANARGGYDNITIVVTQVLKS
jgi:protein phosphatase